MDFSGQANAKELAEVFQMVATSRRPGQLLVGSGERRVSFYFSPDGVTLLSNGCLRSDDLAADLVAEGCVSDEQAEQALTQQERRGGHLGEILYDHGAIDEDHIQSIVFREIQDELLSLCTWDSATFEFREGDLTPDAEDEYRFATRFSFNPEELLVDVARRMDEWRRIEEAIPDGDTIFVMADEGGAAIMEGGPAATSVAVLVDGTRTADEIVAASNCPRFDVLSALRQFLASGRIRPATIEELLDRAQTLKKQREFDRAAHLYSHLAGLRPGDAVMPLRGGQLHERLGNAAEALRLYRRAVETLLASDMHDQAAAIVDTMKGLDPDDTFALEASVNLRLAAGQAPQAAADARHLTDLLAGRGKAAEAARFAAILSDLAPDDLEAKRRLANLLGQAGQGDRAVEHLETLAARLRGGEQDAELAGVLHDIRRLDPRRPILRRSAGKARAPRPTARRWGRTALIAALGGIVAAGVTFAIIYEAQARTAFESVRKNAGDLARHRRYVEAAALYEEVGRRFVYATVAGRADRARRNMVARGRRYAGKQIQEGSAAAYRSVEGVRQTVEAPFEGIADETGAAALGLEEMAAAVSLFAQARRFEEQAKYAAARATYAELVRSHPDLSVYLNVELPLKIESVPRGARVLVNGKEVGRTPLLVRQPPFSAYRIEIQQAGFEPYEATAAPGAPVRLEAELTRRPKWVFRTKGGIESAVARDGPRLYCGSRDGHVYAVEAATGRLIWKFDTGALGDVTCSPALAGDLLFVGSHDHHIYALDRETGRERWRFKTGRLVRSSPCVVDGARGVCVGSYDRSIYTLNAETGRLRWQFRTAGPVVGSPATCAGVVIVGSLDHNVYALTVTDGALKWRYQAGGAIYSSAAAADGVVYFGADDGFVYALDGETGRVRWSFKTGGPVEGAPCVERGVVYIGGTDGCVYALKAADGTLSWKYRTGGSIRGAPVVAGRYLYVGSEDRHLHVVDLATGRLLWKARTEGPVASAPVIAGDWLYVGSRDGGLYAFRVSADVAEAPRTVDAGAGRDGPRSAAR